MTTTTLLILIGLAVVGWIVWKLAQNPDKNNDGKVDAEDVLAAAKEVADDVKEVTNEVKAEASEVVKKVKKGRKKNVE